MPKGSFSGLSRVASELHWLEPPMPAPRVALRCFQHVRWTSAENHLPSLNRSYYRLSILLSSLKFLVRDTCGTKILVFWLLGQSQNSMVVLFCSWDFSSGLLELVTCPELFMWTLWSDCLSREAHSSGLWPPANVQYLCSSLFTVLTDNHSNYHGGPWLEYKDSLNAHLLRKVQFLTTPES